MGGRKSRSKERRKKSIMCMYIGFKHKRERGKRAEKFRDSGQRGLIAMTTKKGKTLNATSGRDGAS